MGMMAPQMGHTMAELSESEEEMSTAVAPPQAATAAAAAVDAAAPAVPSASPVVPLESDGPINYDKKPNADVSKRGMSIRGMPRCRLVAAVVALKLSSDIDPGYLSELSQNGLAMMLWIFTRIRPATKTANLSLLAATNQGLIDQMGIIAQTYRQLCTCSDVTAIYTCQLTIS